jgi:primosomal protein N' (replication factor Y)
MPNADPILRVAIPSPLYRSFDYLPPADRATPGTVGARVLVPFGRTQKVGVVLETASSSELPPERLKRAVTVIDREPLLPPDLMRLGRWLADYYKQPVGEAFAALFPTLLRQGQAATVRGEPMWRLTEAGRRTRPETIKGASRQAQLLAVLHQQPKGVTQAQLGSTHSGWRAPLDALARKGLAVREYKPCLPEGPLASPGPAPEPTDEQARAIGTLRERLKGFNVTLVEGVTGSGKTEVYLALMEKALGAGRQVLMLVPEIGLTPQLIERVQKRLGRPIAVLHSALTDRERLCAWSAAREGQIEIVLGTRSAVFTPLARPGLLLVDEEHDGSYKQQDGLRYHARDVAVLRASQLDIPIVLGSATPSLETLRNVETGRYGRVVLSERATGASMPRLGLLDVRHQRLEAGLSGPLLTHIDDHLQRGGQVLLFLNRRGYSPVLLCHDCGGTAHCPRCDALMTFHRGSETLRCHHCGGERPLPSRCPDCGGGELVAVGQGTERLEEALTERFGVNTVVRIDRDTTRRKGALEQQLDRARSGQARILIGTQMLAKGHDFPGITLVGIVDADSGLFAVDLRATEHLAQQIVQVIGRAGRAERPGEALIQTHLPDHPLLRTLLNEGYDGFARDALIERREAGMPPFASQALFRAEAVKRGAPEAFLEAARAVLQTHAATNVSIIGPIPAPMERRAGRYRHQLILHTDSRRELHETLTRSVPLIAELRESRSVRWSLDVDPMELY